ncbi:hypothetical protein C900_04219 [Fulvivirga imtechensis AK7]|uniref:Uncharacterized protein n=1 Tax=Fulvivirga imtechensis AK7 TaxID=1237149 RepID=L8K1N9_9BACT|nr:hypothetical protein C900_04219 [Fulvivirga imtechensis AK7]
MIPDAAEWGSGILIPDQSSKNKKEAENQLPFVIVAGRGEFSNFLEQNFSQILEGYAKIYKRE